MPETHQPEAKPKARKPRPGRRNRGIAWATVFSLTVAGLVFFVLALALSGRAVPVPEFVRANVEDRLNARIDGAPLRLGPMQVAVGRNGVPQLLLNDIRLADTAGGAIAELNWLGAEMSVERLLKGEFAAESLFLTGAQITIRRTADGSFTLAAGDAMGAQNQTITQVLERIDTAMSADALAALSEVTAGGVVIALEDARSGRIWQATNATATLRKSEDSLSLSVTSDVFNGSDDLAALQVSLTRNRATGHVQLGVTVADMPAADIAAQSPVLSWLRVLDAPISGAVRTELDETGALVSFAGTLDIDAGALQPAENVPPVAFKSAKAYFTFDPVRQRIDFSEVNLVAKDGNLNATGHTYLTEFDGLWPGAYLGQFRVDQLAYEGGDTFDGPVALKNIRSDTRLRLDPFTLEFGQIVIDNDGAPITARGRVTADDSGWHAALDAQTERLSTERVLAYWPRRVSPITRGWLSRNLSQGTLLGPAVGVRFDTGAKPDISLSFGFEDGTARFLPRMPKLTHAAGRAALHDHRFSLSLLEGQITAASGQRIDATGTRFTVPDVRPRPSWGEIDVDVKGALPAVLSVLNNPPLRLMERAKRPTDIATADTRTRARIRLPLKDGIEAEDVSYTVTAQLTDVTSDKLVSGRVLTSAGLQLRATQDEIGLDGPARLDGVPLTVSWRQPLGEAASDGSQIVGRVTLSPDTVDVFNLPLPDGMLAGEGRADYTLSLPPDADAPARLELTSDLTGLSLGLDALGWRKSPGQSGTLVVNATLGAVPQVEALTLSAPGLSLDGRLDLAEDASLKSARFTDLRIGNWLDAEVDLTPSPNGGAPRITVLGGTLDLRQLDLDGSGRGRGAGATPIELRLDRLTVSDGIAFAPLIGQIEAGARGLSGTFQARINGQTPITGTLAPANAGTAIRIRSQSAAGVLRDAGLTPNAREGTLDLVLTPVPGSAGGTFDGEFLIENVRLRKAPAMADLLDAISVVGLLDQLSGPGIRFETVDGQFRLDRRQIRLKQAAAVGTSIGISADGIYDLRSDRMDFRGVVSPVYFLNGIGSILTRRGEGLFGFNYRMAGPAADPSVRVNPLSILTPGAFRQIFRRAPPGG